MLEHQQYENVFKLRRKESRTESKFHCSSTKHNHAPLQNIIRAYETKILIAKNSESEHKMISQKTSFIYRKAIEQDQDFKLEPANTLTNEDE